MKTKLMGYFEYYLDALRKYVVFEGRASRKDYWMFVLVNMVIGVVIRIVEAILGMDEGFLSSLYTVAMLCPNIALCARRLHDVNRSGWWQLASVVPLLNFYYIYLLWFKPGKPETNKFGAPIYVAAAPAADSVYGEYSVPVEEAKPAEAEAAPAAYTPPLANEFASYEMCPAPAEAKKCSFCGTVIENGAKFCSECGAPADK